MVRFAFAAATLAAVFSLVSVSFAEDMIGSPERGHELALDVCSECHWASEEQFVIPDSGAPSFFQLAEDPAYSPIALRVALQTPHNKMPNLILTQEETDNIIAYIMALREKR